MPILGKLTGLRGLLEQCHMGPGARVDRVVFGVHAFDRLLGGAVVAMEGGFDAPTVVGCLLRMPTRLALKPFQLGPYPGGRGSVASRSLLVMAIARNTILVAVGKDADLVPRILNGRSDGMHPTDAETHFGQGAQGAAITVTAPHIFASEPSLLFSPIRWAIDVTRAAWLQVWLRGAESVTLRGALLTKGSFAALRLQLQWKLVTALLSRLDPNAGVILAALQASRQGKEMNLSMEGGPAERAAWTRLSARLLGGRGAAAPPAAPPPDAPAPTGAPPPPEGAPPPDGAPTDGAPPPAPPPE
jgi:hypothetical protein